MITVGGGVLFFRSANELFFPGIYLFSMFFLFRLYCFAEASECFICRDVQLVDGEQLKRFCGCKNLMAHHGCLLAWVRMVCFSYFLCTNILHFAHLC